MVVMHQQVVLEMLCFHLYVRNGQSVRNFTSLVELGKKLEPSTCAALLSKAGTIAWGKQVHAFLIVSKIHEIFLSNTLIGMYARWGSMVDSFFVFDNMPERNIVSWNAMLSAYFFFGYGKEALGLFCHMNARNLEVNINTFNTILKVCDTPLFFLEAKLIHAHSIYKGFESDVVLGTSLVHMYSKCSKIEDAWSVFNKMVNRNLVTWNAMIAAYVFHGLDLDALHLFWDMCRIDVKPDHISFISCLNACNSHAFLEEGKLLHAYIYEVGCKSSVVVGNALVNMYGKANSVANARVVFGRMPKKDLITWSTLIAAYSEQMFEEAIRLFWEMCMNNVTPNNVTFVGVLNACAHAAYIAEGILIHSQIFNSGLHFDIIVGAALVDMYAESGNLENAYEVFSRVPVKDVALWNAMIMAYAHHGNIAEALLTFGEMQQCGMLPNAVTLINILFACSHAGLVHEGCHYFAAMSKDYNVTATSEHYGCIIDLFRRAGQFDESEDFMKEILLKPSVALFMSSLPNNR